MAQLAAMICQGMLDKDPRQKVIFQEGGYWWIGPGAFPMKAPQPPFIPAQAGIQSLRIKYLGPRLRGDERRATGQAMRGEHGN